MKHHSNTSYAVQLAKKLYDECQTVKPNWNQLQPYGPCQQVWIERAEKMMILDPDRV
jgi:hypothetical protein